ncbi:MAG: AAA family ATPase [Magnetococcales bacterium]|nr:AAA family ATPase [Magnetococcales bacterium]MBF0322623.1 AAA family ATPase [Magnetococcales bacterium]
MINRLQLTNFTVFEQADLSFSPGLNVVVGVNGTGKSHLLKLAYALHAVSAEEGRKGMTDAPTKTAMQPRLAEKLVHVFRPDSLGRLARRKQGRERCEVEAEFAAPGRNIAFDFAYQSKSEVNISQLPTEWADKSPAFFPTRELLTIFPKFVSLYEERYLEFEETYRDTCLLLGAPSIKGSRESTVRKLLTPLEEAMGGKIVLDKTGRFYLNLPGKGNLEMPLVAEGLRKLGMVSRLIATGTLLDQGVLFWDEPETNLNPRLIRLMAQTILDLCRNGIQVFVATHSLFLLKEFDILLASQPQPGVRTRYFALNTLDDGVTVSQGDSSGDVDPIAALDEELLQADRYLEGE